MIIGKDFFITEFGKTGTSFLREYFEQYKDINLSPKHDFIVKENISLLSKKLRVTTMRNPFSWYVSLWKWSCKMQKKSPIYADLTSRRIKFKRLKPGVKTLNYLYAQFFKNIVEWKQLFEDPNSKLNFNTWIKKILDKNSKLEIGSDYSFTTSDDLGYMSFQFLSRNCLKEDLNVLYETKYSESNSLETLFEKKFTNYTLRTESLIDDLKILLKKLNYETLDFDTLDSYQPKDKTSEYFDFYNEENKKKVFNKDKIIFKKYYPKISI